jgi:hypothetical protein
MRRMIASAKNALHRNNRQNDPPQNNPPQDNQVQLDQSQSHQIAFNVSLNPAPPGGYTCWDQTECGLCSRFLDRRFIFDMFTTTFADVGNITDLITWSQVGGRCALCNYISLLFFNETRGQIPLDARFIIRWNTRHTAIKEGGRDEVPSFKFEFRWELQAWSITLRCFTNEGKLNIFC